MKSPGRPPAVVLGGSANGLSLARSLGRRGIPTLMLDSERRLGTYTRFAAFGQLPPAASRPDAWIDLLTYAGQRLDRPAVLFATSDEHCLLAAEHSETLAAYFQFAIPEAATARQILDKRCQYEVARSAGIRVPESHYPDSVEAARTVAGRSALLGRTPGWCSN